MAIFHVHAQIISKSDGRSAVGAAAYRSASMLREIIVDGATGITTERVWDYRAKKGVVYSKIIAPEAAPEWVYDRELLWNKVTQKEIRKDGQLAREYDIALQIELSKEQNITLLEDIVDECFIKEGMIGDVNFHHDNKNNPHLHVMLTTRKLKKLADGRVDFGLKCRLWNKRSFHNEVRAKVAQLTNKHLEMHGFSSRVSHLSHKERGIELTPTVHVGPAGKKMINHERRELNLQIIKNNAARIIANPELVLQQLSINKPVFTTDEIAVALNDALMLVRIDDIDLTDSIKLTDDIVELALSERIKKYGPHKLDDQASDSKINHQTDHEVDSKANDKFGNENDSTKLTDDIVELTLSERIKKYGPYQPNDQVGNHVGNQVDYQIDNKLVNKADNKTDNKADDGASKTANNGSVAKTLSPNLDKSKLRDLRDEEDLSTLDHDIAAEFIVAYAKVIGSGQLKLMVEEDLRGNKLYALTKRIELENRYETVLGQLAQTNIHALDIKAEALGTNSTHEHLSSSLKLFSTKVSNKIALLTDGKIKTEQKQEVLSAEQQAAVLEIVNGSDLSVLEGLPGAGKTTVMREIVRQYQLAGKKVVGAAPSSNAAMNLASVAGIEARNLTQWRKIWLKQQGAAKEFSLDLKSDYYLEEHYQEPKAGLDSDIKSEIGISAGDKAAQQFDVTGLQRLKDLSSKAKSALTQVKSQMESKIQQIKAPNQTANQVTSKFDVMIIDESSMVELANMDYMVNEAKRLGAKIILVGDNNQFSAVGMQGAFKKACNIAKVSNLTEVRRQKDPKQAEATKLLGDYKILEALKIYKNMISVYDDDEDTKDGLVSSYVEGYLSKANAIGNAVGIGKLNDELVVDKQIVICAYTNGAVSEFNSRVRSKLLAAGVMKGESINVRLGNKSLALAKGEQIVFEQNSAEFDVLNGEVGTVINVRKKVAHIRNEAVDTADTKGEVVNGVAENNTNNNGAEAVITVKVLKADGSVKTIKLDSDRYSKISYGYAVTAHKLQGATVNDCLVYYEPIVGYEAFNVMMTRHKDRVGLYVSAKALEDIAYKRLEEDPSLARKHHEIVPNKIEPLWFIGLNMAVSRRANLNFANDYLQDHRTINNLEEASDENTRIFTPQERQIRRYLDAHTAVITYLSTISEWQRKQYRQTRVQAKMWEHELWEKAMEHKSQRDSAAASISDNYHQFKDLLIRLNINFANIRKHAGERRYEYEVKNKQENNSIAWNNNYYRLIDNVIEIGELDEETIGGSRDIEIIDKILVSHHAVKTSLLEVKLNILEVEQKIVEVTHKYEHLNNIIDEGREYLDLLLPEFLSRVYQQSAKQTLTEWEQLVQIIGMEEALVRLDQDPEILGKIQGLGLGKWVGFNKTRTNAIMGVKKLCQIFSKVALLKNDMDKANAELEEGHHITQRNSLMGTKERLELKLPAKEEEQFINKIDHFIEQARLEDDSIEYNSLISVLISREFQEIADDARLNYYNSVQENKISSNIDNLNDKNWTGVADEVKEAQEDHQRSISKAVEAKDGEEEAHLTYDAQEMTKQKQSAAPKIKQEQNVAVGEITPPAHSLLDDGKEITKSKSTKLTNGNVSTTALAAVNADKVTDVNQVTVKNATTNNNINENQGNQTMSQPAATNKQVKHRAAANNDKNQSYQQQNRFDNKVDLFKEVKSSLTSWNYERIFYDHAKFINSDGAIKKQGRRIMCGSLNMNLDSGLWMRHSTGQKGDIFNFVMEAKSYSKKEALQVLAEYAGISSTYADGNKVVSVEDISRAKADNKLREEQSSSSTSKGANDNWIIYKKVANDVPEFNAKTDVKFLLENNKLIARFDYCNINNELIGHTIRVEGNDDGKKQVLPVSYWHNYTRDQNQWRLKGFTDELGNKPIYGLEKLGNKSSQNGSGDSSHNKEILIVEGEKAADRAQELFPEYSVISWLGGSKVAGKVDWGQLQGREIIIWPDNDVAGFEAATVIAAAINYANNNVGRVCVVNPAVKSLRLPEKWDLADELPTGVLIQDIKDEIIKNQLKAETIDYTNKVSQSLAAAGQLDQEQLKIAQRVLWQQRSNGKVLDGSEAKAIAAIEHEWLAKLGDKSVVLGASHLAVKEDYSDLHEFLKLDHGLYRDCLIVGGIRQDIDDRNKAKAKLAGSADNHSKGNLGHEVKTGSIMELPLKEMLHKLQDSYVTQARVAEANLDASEEYVRQERMLNKHGSAAGHAELYKILMRDFVLLHQGQMSANRLFDFHVEHLSKTVANQISSYKKPYSKRTNSNKLDHDDQIKIADGLYNTIQSRNWWQELSAIGIDRGQTQRIGKMSVSAQEDNHQGQITATEASASQVLDSNSLQLPNNLLTGLSAELKANLDRDIGLISSRELMSAAQIKEEFEQEPDFTKVAASLFKACQDYFVGQARAAARDFGERNIIEADGRSFDSIKTYLEYQLNDHEQGKIYLKGSTVETYLVKLNKQEAEKEQTLGTSPEAPSELSLEEIETRAYLARLNQQRELKQQQQAIKLVAKEAAIANGQSDNIVNDKRTGTGGSQYKQEPKMIDQLQEKLGYSVNTIHNLHSSIQSNVQNNAWIKDLQGKADLFKSYLLKIFDRFKEMFAYKLHDSKQLRAYLQDDEGKVNFMQINQQQEQQLHAKAEVLGSLDKDPNGQHWLEQANNNIKLIRTKNIWSDQELASEIKQDSSHEEIAAKTFKACQQYFMQQVTMDAKAIDSPKRIVERNGVRLSDIRRYLEYRVQLDQESKPYLQGTKAAAYLAQIHEKRKFGDAHFDWGDVNDNNIVSSLGRDIAILRANKLWSEEGIAEELADIGLKKVSAKAFKACQHHFIKLVKDDLEHFQQQQFILVDNVRFTSIQKYLEHKLTKDEQAKIYLQGTEADKHLKQLQKAARDKQELIQTATENVFRDIKVLRNKNIWSEQQIADELKHDPEFMVAAVRTFKACQYYFIEQARKDVKYLNQHKFVLVGDIKFTNIQTYLEYRLSSDEEAKIYLKGSKAEEHLAELYQEQKQQAKLKQQELEHALKRDLHFLESEGIWDREYLTEQLKNHPGTEQLGSKAFTACQNYFKRQVVKDLDHFKQHELISRNGIKFDNIQAYLEHTLTKDEPAKTYLKGTELEQNFLQLQLKSSVQEQLQRKLDQAINKKSGSPEKEEIRSSTATVKSTNNITSDNDRNAAAAKQLIDSRPKNLADMNLKRDLKLIEERRIWDKEKVLNAMNSSNSSAAAKEAFKACQHHFEQEVSRAREYFTDNRHVTVKGEKFTSFRSYLQHRLNKDNLAHTYLKGTEAERCLQALNQQHQQAQKLQQPQHHRDMGIDR